MYNEKKCYVIVVAGGAGRRFGGDVPKQFQLLGDMPVLLHSTKKFDKMEIVDGIILVTFPKCRAPGIKKLMAIVAGGATRQESVYNGLLQINDTNCIVIIHDAARPFVCENAVISLVDAAYKHRAATLALPVTDTIKMADAEHTITQTMPRENLYTIQTPQAFCKEALLAAHNLARDSGGTATDDCGLLEKIGTWPKIVLGNADNIKLTNAIDLDFATLLLKRGM